MKPHRTLSWLACLLILSALHWASAEELPTKTLSDDQLLTQVQRQTFRYFNEAAEPNSGMALERVHPGKRRPGSTVATGGSGFGIMAWIVAAERGFVTRSQALDRLEIIVGFLEKADRFHGAWPHWLNGKTGAVVPFSAKDDGADLVETAYLIQGLLAARQWMPPESERERKLAERINQLWRAVEWDWFRRDGENVLYWHWSPKFGWEMNFRLRGYNECLITYVLAASSPTHSIPATVYHEGWARNGKIRNPSPREPWPLALRHNGKNEKGGPLFWAHYSYLGLDPRGLKDRYAEYWTHNRNHTLLNWQHCVDNPHGYKGYGEKRWGLTSSYSLKFYAGHSPAHDLGVISPTAALSSFPYTPDRSMKALRCFYEEMGDQLWGPYGFYDAFSQEADWVSDGYLAIDQGPIIIMIENHRSALLWELFMSCDEIQAGLNKLDFQHEPGSVK